MGLLDRASTLIRANLNDLMDRAEDPEKVIVQCILDMENHLVEVRGYVATAIAAQNTLSQKYQENLDACNEWQRKAELAVDRGLDDLAKEALTRRNNYHQSAEGFHQEWEAQSSQVTDLKNALHELERKIDEARAKKDLLIARSRRAKAETKIHETMAGIGKSNALADFERMEEKVSSQEARAKAVAELAGDTMESQFAELEETSTLDADLAALKSKRAALQGPQQPQLEVPAEEEAAVTLPRRRRKSD